VTGEDFRRLALALPQAVEQGHRNHPDFRVGGKIFATLDGAERRGALKLTPDQQEVLMAAEPGLFNPAAGAWGARGWTHIELPGADEGAARSALAMAWRNTAPKALVGAGP